MQTWTRCRLYIWGSSIGHGAMRVKEIKTFCCGRPRAAVGRYYMTKRALMGLTGLTSDEANTLPRTLKQRPRSRGGGVMWAYSPTVAPAALAMVGGMEGRRIRLAYRVIASTSTELSFVGGRGYDCHSRAV